MIKVTLNEEYLVSNFWDLSAIKLFSPYNFSILQNDSIWEIFFISEICFREAGSKIKDLTEL